MPREDRFIGQPGDSVLSDCLSCKYKRTGPTCKAFPDGIPDDILDGSATHKEPYKGDKGIQWTRDEPTTPWWIPLFDRKD